VGVVPAIKPAAQLTKSNVIGLLATPATIERKYTDRLIKDFASNCEVIKVGSSRLVEIAEDKLYGKVIDPKQIKAELQLLLDSNEMDVLVLACTHFPLLNKEIRSFFDVDNDMKLVDSGSGIANRVSQLLTNLESEQTHNDESVAVFTALNNISLEFKQQLNLYGFTNIERLL
ncbi:UNVERIFIED_CONTAM: hypothetical protein GTU68_047200, partial [Idotea baltica]|nr:hypothetical protein [Idotea baltica]